MSRKRFFKGHAGGPQVSNQLPDSAGQQPHVQGQILGDDDLIFGPAVAKLLNISLTTFHQRRRSGEFPIPEVAPRLDKRPRFRRGDVLAFIRQRAA